MTQPENFTAAQASDPQTPGQMLADIAAQRPDLRPAVAANPSTYPALLDWLKSLGEPAVDAALASRAQATQVMPAQPTGPVTPPAPSWAGAPAGAQAPAPAYAATPAYSAPPQGMAPGGMPPGGMPPGGMTPGYAGMPPAKKSNKTLWIVLGIIGVVLLLSVVAVILIIQAAKDTVEDVGDDISDVIDDVTDVPSGDATAFGDDPTLDALYTACDDDDWQACDDLYRSSPRGSEYWQFGDTCGGDWDSGTTTFCVEAMGGGSDEPVEESFTAAETLYFEALQSACAAEDWAACDELYTKSPLGSEYEAFGSTCGERTEGTSGSCDVFAGVEDPGPPMTRGSSAGLDALWTACEGGDTEACGVMYRKSPIDSEYETYGRDHM